MTAAGPGATAEDHWRRQLVLTLLAVGVAVVSLRLMAWSIAREQDVYQVIMADGRRVRSVSYLVTLWPAALGICAVVAVFGLLIVHAYRVARFTFGPGTTPRGELQ